jgi:hypothetical protein
LIEITTERVFYDSLPELAVLEIPECVRHYHTELKKEDFTIDIRDVFDDTLCLMTDDEETTCEQFGEYIEELINDINAGGFAKNGEYAIDAVITVMTDLEKAAKPLLTPSGIMHFAYHADLLDGTIVLKKKPFRDEDYT